MELDHIRIFLAVVTLSCLAGIIIVTLAKPERGRVEIAFLGLVCALFAWYLLHTLSFYLTRYYSPSYAVGSLAGVAVMLVGVSIYAFCEYFPEGTHTKHSRKRLLAALIITLCLAPLTFSRSWIANRGAGAITGPFFYVTSAWVVFASAAGIFLQLQKLSRTEDLRRRINIRRLLLTILFNVAVTVVLAVVLPMLGSWKYFFFGPTTAVMGLAFILYAVQFHQMVNMRAMIFEMGLRVALSLFLCSLIYIGLMVLLTGEPGGFSFRLAAFSLIFFFSGVLYSIFLHPRLQRMLFPPRESAEDLILRTYLGHVAGTHGSLEGLLKEVLEGVTERLGLERSLIVVMDHNDRLTHHRIGDFGDEIKAIAARLVYSRTDRERRFPPEFVQEGDRLFLLDEGRSVPFLKKTRFTLRYAHLVRRTAEHRKRVIELGCRIVVPLVFRREIGGYLFLGDKRSHRPFFAEDVKFLDSVRSPLAAIVHTHTHYEKVQQLKTAAEEKLRQLAVKSEKDVIRHSIGKKTLVYRSAKMQDVMARIRRVAPLSRPLLIYGETGTGKELMAGFAHQSSRADKPFVSINCAALPPALWEDEIFGHVKGAFTDARADRAGAVSRAGEGTLFLDEIGEMPADMQAKLLRLLQERQYSPLGSSTVVKANCRFIFATNRDLERLVAEGGFREDLFYRINVFRIDLPPLRERSEDIECIARELVVGFSSEMDANRTLDAEALHVLKSHNWPGNVREMENVILRALAHAAGPLLTKEDFREIQRSSQTPSRSRAENLDLKEGTFHEVMDAFALRVIQGAMEKAGGNKTRAAQILGIRRSSLDYRLKELKIG